MKSDIPPQPLQVGLLRAQGEVTGTHLLPCDCEQTRLTCHECVPRREPALRLRALMKAARRRGGGSRFLGSVGCACNGSMQRRRSVYPLGFESPEFLEVFGSASVRLRPGEPVSESRDRFSSGSTVEAGR